jgi:hypothetical protein
MTTLTFMPVPARTVPSLLDGREYDRRVTYGTLVAKPSKAYPVVGKRQRERAARKDARVAATVDPTRHDDTI